MVKWKKAVSTISALALSFTLFGAIAQAATYTCDNDPTSASGCTHGYNGTWTLSTGVTGSRNGDHRLSAVNAPNTAEYYWYVTNLTSAGTYKLQAYLAHSSFTNQTARYYVGNVSWSSLDYVGMIDQEAASSGWNNINTYNVTLSSGKVAISVNGYDDYNTNTRTGADSVQLVSN
ncbi:MAG: hypothetical protein K0R55_3697 [Sporomusa sp.]|nr:hypothetical protein [Sporomusa sp.]